MNPSFDIFQVQNNSVLWVAPAASLEEAEIHISGLVQQSNAEYFVVDQRTGDKTAIKLDSIRSSAQSA